MADDDRTTKPSRATRGGRDTSGGRTTGEEKVNEVSVQPAPEVDDDAPDKGTAVGGEGHVSRAEGVAAAQAGNEEVASRFQVEQQQGFWGENPAAERNSDNTYAGQVEFLAKSKEEQDRILRERHEEDVLAARANDWS